MELILLIIVALSVIALIYIAIKSKALEEESFIDVSDISEKSSTTSTTPTSIKQEKEEPSGPPQNTIYEFSTKAGKRLCSFCDGENGDGAKVCKICGRDI